MSATGEAKWGADYITLSSVFWNFSKWKVGGIKHSFQPQKFAHIAMLQVQQFHSGIQTAPRPPPTSLGLVVTWRREGRVWSAQCTGSWNLLRLTSSRPHGPLAPAISMAKPGGNPVGSVCLLGIWRMRLSNSRRKITHWHLESNCSVTHPRLVIFPRSLADKGLQLRSISKSHALFFSQIHVFF